MSHVDVMVASVAAVTAFVLTAALCGMRADRRNTSK